MKGLFVFSKSRAAGRKLRLGIMKIVQDLAGVKGNGEWQMWGVSKTAILLIVVLVRQGPQEIAL
jgi:hypothetical protein